MVYKDLPQVPKKTTAKYISIIALCLYNNTGADS